MSLKQPFRILGLALVVSCAGASFARTLAAEAPPSLTAVLRGVEKRYNRLSSMKAHFWQTVRQEPGLLRQEEGELYLRKPGRMRWEYTSPEPKLFVTDGKQVSLYLPVENRVMESTIKETEDLKAPLAFLLGRLNFEEQFQRLETSPQLVPLEKDNYVFKAYSNKLAERLEWVIFEIAPDYEIRRLVARERGGLETEFRFQTMQTNPQLADRLFRFTPPQGAEVVRE
ncbi:MAG TPA: outer membrane lipoprotein chaperone LolA [Terriglobia bacterium]|nr:outer membrane lipoprotein chaperone LolA [Terriglobia bacterium]